VGVATHFIKKYLPTKTQMDLTEYYGEVPEGEAALILGTEKLEVRGLIWEDSAYIPLDVVSAKLNKRYYWDAENQQVLYATPTGLGEAPAAEDGGQEVWLKDGTVDRSIPYIQKYTDIDVYINEDPARVAIQYQFQDVNCTSVTKDTDVRYRGGIKSE